eukprot:7676638-Alexandrium_andersonii.AAC.1
MGDAHVAGTEPALPAGPAARAPTMGALRTEADVAGFELVLLIALAPAAHRAGTGTAGAPGILLERCAAGTCAAPAAGPELEDSTSAHHRVPP